MKKSTGIIISVALVAGVVALLAVNKAKVREQTSETIEIQKSVKVRTFKLGTEAVSLSFSANGAVQALSELNYVSDISGRVVRILVEKGARVQAGTPLLKLDDELYEADYKAALAAYESLKKDEARFTRSNQAGGVTGQQLDNVRTQLIAAESRLARSRKQYEDCTVKSPMSGTINSRYVEPGSLIAPNAPLFDIVDDSQLKVTCYVPESRVRVLSKGQKVTLTSSSLPGEIFTGSIAHVGLKTDSGLNYPVEIRLDRNDLLKIGMYLKANFAETGEHEGILVPRKAIVGSAKSATVFVVKDGVAYQRQVSLGEMSGDRVEILAGLESGDEVIVAGIMNVADGASVSIAE